jgi:hypothetical protein
MATKKVQDQGWQKIRNTASASLLVSDSVADPNPDP